MDHNDSASSSSTTPGPEPSAASLPAPVQNVWKARMSQLNFKADSPANPSAPTPASASAPYNNKKKKPVKEEVTQTIDADGFIVVAAKDSKEKPYAPVVRKTKSHKEFKPLQTPKDVPQSPEPVKEVAKKTSTVSVSGPAPAKIVQTTTRSEVITPTPSSVSAPIAPISAWPTLSTPSTQQPTLNNQQQLQTAAPLAPGRGGPWAKLDVDIRYTPPSSTGGAASKKEGTRNHEKGNKKKNDGKRNNIKGGKPVLAAATDVLEGSAVPVDSNSEQATTNAVEDKEVVSVDDIVPSSSTDETVTTATENEDAAVPVAHDDGTVAAVPEGHPQQEKVPNHRGVNNNRSVNNNNRNNGRGKSLRVQRSPRYANEKWIYTTWWSSWGYEWPLAWPWPN
ncbi:hypothetical protein BDR26DRAFT_390107 [Obelidium mucronatum]|nr:hypothetical protein BDR26DRAFT_390107 [Obelidium mucronatum]